MMKDDLDQKALEAAHRYRVADNVPREAIWRDVEARRTTPASGRPARRVAAVAATAAIVFMTGLTAGWWARSARIDPDQPDGCRAPTH
jgi:hypothetical protein